MKISCSAYVASSIDGYIARQNGDVDWLHDPEYTIESEDFGYKTYMDTVDAILMGRNTFDKVLTFGQWPYTKPVFVLTASSPELSSQLSDREITFMEGEPESVLQDLSEKGFRHLYIDGGKTISSFLNKGLLHEITITSIPVILGSGIPLFSALDDYIHLELISTATFENGFTQNVYRPNHKNQG